MGLSVPKVGEEEDEACECEGYEEPAEDEELEVHWGVPRVVSAVAEV
jgi:hypothetical protein